jgi:hypothetical protein
MNNEKKPTPTSNQPKEFEKVGGLDIPASFELGALEVKTIRDDNFVKDKGMVAESRYNEQEISIDMLHARKEFTEQAFLHEVTHWILFMMNEDGLRNNERFVDLFAHFLYQFHKTAGFKIDRTQQKNKLLNYALQVLEENCSCGSCGPCQLAKEIRVELGMAEKESTATE